MSEKKTHPLGKFFDNMSNKRVYLFFSNAFFACFALIMIIASISL